MTLTPGTLVGPYEIIALIGVGGMGEVYRARDTRLNRDVAIKVLLPEVSNDPDRLMRLGREAQVLASLNHPNIAAIYGIEDSGGVRALVMEFVEGPMLADLIGKGTIAFNELLSIARQIAEALDTAHDQGITHRDLKPANIKVRPDGTVKVLDFGLARPTERMGLRDSTSMQSTRLTQAGVILGTAAYMAPEQARGQAVDKRADIWAFGVVLYEMLTGNKPFRGENEADILAEVINAEPQYEEIPSQLKRLLKACLEKDKKRRLRDIGDVWCLMDSAVASPAAGVAEAFLSEGYVNTSPAFRQALATCSELDMLGFGHNRMTSTYAPQLTDILLRGGRLRAIAIDPKSKAVIESNRRSFVPRSPKAARHQHEAAQALLRAIGEHATTPEAFAMRTIDFAPPFTIYSFDRSTPARAQVFVWLTPWRRPSAERPGFSVAARDSATWYGFFVSQLESIWAEAVPQTSSLSRSPRPSTSSR